MRFIINQVTCEYNYENVLTVVGENNIPELAEWHVYGNEQQGRFLTVYPTRQYLNTNSDPTQRVFYGAGLSEDIRNGIFKRQLGNKAYELKDHLGNVRVTFSDVKIPTAPYTTPFEVDLLSKVEYFPGGMPITELTYQLENKRYGYNSGSEIDKEIFAQKDRAFSTLFREGDTYTLRWWSQDPKRNELPHQSTYSYMDANPILKNDPLGDLSEEYIIKSGFIKLRNNISPDNINAVSNSRFARIKGLEGEERVNVFDNGTYKRDFNPEGMLEGVFYLSNSVTIQDGKNYKERKKQWLNEENLGKDEIVHHIFPREHEEKFQKLYGIDINDPWFTIVLPKSEHKGYDAKHREYNAKWKTFFKDNEYANIFQVLKNGYELMQEVYKIEPDGFFNPLPEESNNP